MFTIFKEEKVITAGILVFLCLSVLVRLMLAWMYHTMIRETDNMATTGNRLLKQCKVKFANCYQLNGGVSNIPVFVDKFLNRLSFGHLSFGMSPDEFIEKYKESGMVVSEQFKKLAKDIHRYLCGIYGSESVFLFRAVMDKNTPRFFCLIVPMKDNEVIPYKDIGYVKEQKPMAKAACS